MSVSFNKLGRGQTFLTEYPGSGNCTFPDQTVVTTDLMSVNFNKLGRVQIFLTEYSVFGNCTFMNLLKE
jgi:hypothetical protein